MSYENAPATVLLATHCVCCQRPLVDSVSVEAGMGPTCRKNHGYNDGPVENRPVANRLVWVMALVLNHGATEEQLRAMPEDLRDVAVMILAGPHGIPALVAQLKTLGFTRLASILAARLATVVINADAGGILAVKTPYSEEVTNALRSVPGRRWDKARKENLFPLASKPALWAVLKTHFSGRLGTGPNGMFVIP